MTTQPHSHHPRLEAQSILPDGYEAYVLEPSPPASLDHPWFADDPAWSTSQQPASAGAALSVTPTSGGEVSWDQLAKTRFADDPAAREFIAQRWLGNWGKLPDLPANYVTQRLSAHRLAFGVISEARRLAAGEKIGLRWVRRGFGTPFFDNDQQVRLVGGEIVWQQGQGQTSQPVSTLRAAGEFLGVTPAESQREHDSPELGDLDEELELSAEANDFFGDWFGCAASAFEELRLAGSNPEDTRVQIWPGHFDMAIDLEEGEARATYGASTGDAAESPEPYLYISPWETHVMVDRDFWNAKTFMGAVLTYQELVASDSPSSHHAVLEFFQGGFEMLRSGV